MFKKKKKSKLDNETLVQAVIGSAVVAGLVGIAGVFVNKNKERGK